MAKQKKEKEREKEKEKKVVKPEKKGFSLTIDEVKLFSLIIVAFSFLIYCNSIGNDYNLDDELVTQNHRITSQGFTVLKPNFDVFGSAEFKDSSFSSKLWHAMPLVFRVPYYEDRAGYKYEYRPMVLASFALEHAIFGKTETVNGRETETDNPHWSHFINVLLYCFACWLLFMVLRRLLKSYSILFPFVITMLFAAHPIHTEVVASIKNRDEIMALIFGLLSLDLSLRFSERRKWYYLLLIPLFFVFAVLSKPTGITFAVIIPLSLAMLTGTGYLTAMLITLLLAIPAAFYSRLYSVFQQIELGALLLFVTSALYFLKNFKSVISWFRNLISGSRQKVKTPVDDGGKGYLPQLDFGLISKPLYLLALGSAVILALVFSASGIYMGKAWLACVPVLLLGLMYFLSAAETRLILITPVTIIALMFMAKFQSQSKPMESVLIAFLVVQILSNQKPFRITGLVNYIIYAIVGIAVLHSAYFLAIFLFAGFYWRKILPVIMGVVGIIALLFVVKIVRLATGSHQFAINLVTWPVLITCFLLMWRQKGDWLGRFAVIGLGFLMGIYFYSTPYTRNNDITENINKDFYALKKVKAADPTPVQAVRPLKYIEFPVDTADPVSLKLGTSALVMGKYLKMVFVPYPMSYYYGYAYITPVKITEAVPILSLLAYLTLLVVALYFFNRNSLLSFSILFYLVSIAVFSNLVFPIPGIMGDRFLLIPSIGFCIFLAYIFFRLFKQDPATASADVSSITNPQRIILALVLLIYSSETFARNMDWKDRLTLFRHDIHVVENSSQAQNLLGIHLFMTSNREKDPSTQKQLRLEAIPHFKRSLEIYPKFLNASYDLGRTYEALQMYDSAYAQYKHTLEIDSTFLAPYFSMATIEHNNKHYEAAAGLYRKFLVGYPTSMDAWINMSFAYFQMGDYEKSIEVGRSAMQVDPNAVNPIINIGKTFLKINQPDSALVYFEKAHSQQPNEPNVNAVIQQLKGKTATPSVPNKAN